MDRSDCDDLQGRQTTSRYSCWKGADQQREIDRCLEARDEGELHAECHESSTSTKILPSPTSYFARSSASASESTLIAACGWRALIARMASPLSGMATSDHSCSGDAPPGFGSTVTIFHPFAMRLI